MKKTILIGILILSNQSVHATDGDKMVEQHKYEAQAKVEANNKKVIKPKPNEFSNVTMHPKKKVTIHPKKKSSSATIE